MDRDELNPICFFRRAMGPHARLLLLAMLGVSIAMCPLVAQVPPEIDSVAGFYKEHAELPRDGSGPWIERIGKAGGPDLLRKLYDQVTQAHFDSGADTRALEALAEAARVRQVRPAPVGKPVDPVVDPDYQALIRLL